MSLISAAAVFFIIWWLVLFTILPLGVQSQMEADEVTLGTDPGAPHRPRLGRKLLITTAISALVFAAVYLALAVYGLSLEDLIV